MTQAADGTPPNRGLRVTEVFPNSPASAADFHVGDLITQYGEHAIIDDAGFFAAKNHYEDSHIPTVEIVAWRGKKRTSAKVPSGWLGVMSEEDDEVSKEFRGLMNDFKYLQSIPEDSMDKVLKDHFPEGSQGVLRKAKELIDKAETEGALTPVQLQLARIYLIPDDAPADELLQQSALLRDLIATQPGNFIQMLGVDRFEHDKRYRPAIACYLHYLKTSPDDVSARLNLALGYDKIGSYKEAEASANYVFDHHLGLSPQGYFVGYETMALAALGKRDYDRSARLSEEALAIRQDNLFMLKLLQLATARTGDSDRFEKATQKFNEAQPSILLEHRLETDAIEACLLFRNNQRDAAQKLVRKWKDKDLAAGKVLYYWSELPGGKDVANTWNLLMN